MNDTPEGPPLVPVDHDIVASLKETLKLDRMQSNELDLLVRYLTEDIARFLEHGIDPEERAELVNRLERIEKALARLSYEIDKAKPQLEDLLPHDLGEALGSRLTVTAMVKAGASDENIRNVRRRVRSMTSRIDPVTMERLEKQWEPGRKAMGIRYSHLILPELVEALHRPFKQWIEADRQNPGGRPTNRVRDLIVASLIRASQDIIGRGPSSSDRSRFMKLCRGVLAAFGFDETGAEQVVARLVEKKRKRAAAAENPSSSEPA